MIRKSALQDRIERLEYRVERLEENRQRQDAVLQAILRRLGWVMKFKQTYPSAIYEAVNDVHH
jgi:chaperonin cofactor prefoldin